MSKETLNLSIEKSLKRRAKKLAQERGISVSHFFEKLVAEQDQEHGFTLPPDSGTAQFVSAVNEEDKVDDYDYKKMKAKILEEKYGIDKSAN